MTQMMTTLYEKTKHGKAAMLFVVVFAMAIFISVALTNFAVLGLVLIAPFAWQYFLSSNKDIELDIKLLWSLVFALCVWDVATNLLAGVGIGASLEELVHDMRTFGFVIVLWAVFANALTARLAFWTIFSTVLVLASINLLLTLVGKVPQGEYFTTGYRLSHMSHMYGQALVGFVFVLAQMWLVNPKLSWRVAVPLILLLASLVLASERRTGWVLLVAGFGVWSLLNVKRLFIGKYKWWLLGSAISVLAVVASSDVVHRRMALAVVEFNDYLALTPQERSAAIFGSVSIRMQYAATVWEAIKQSNWWIGVGSIGFPAAYQAAATAIEVTPQSWVRYNWGNPHNEYLYVLATKGVVGLMLYLAIFAQACRVAWHKTDEIQRVGLLMFVFLFMLSITTNSMMIDMEEGHFTMLILLVFLAPKSLDLMGKHSKPHQFG
jgi:O-antigen ligase